MSDDTATRELSDEELRDTERALPFAVPCATCGYTDLPIYHGGTGRIYLHGDKDWQHAYELDTASPEYAATKLREALDDLLLSGVELDDERMHYVVMQIDRPTLAAAREASRLADAAGITSGAVNEKTTTGGTKR